MGTEFKGTLKTDNTVNLHSPLISACCNLAKGDELRTTPAVLTSHRLYAW